MKSKLKALNKKTEKVFKESEVGALLENLNHNVKIIAEGQMDLRKDISVLKEDVNGLRKEMREGFGMIMDYLKLIDDEVVEIKEELKGLKEKKVDRNIYSLLEKRVENAEKQIKELKFMLKEKGVNNGVVA